MQLVIRKTSTLPPPAVLQQRVAADVQDIGEVELSRRTGINRQVLLKLALGRPVLVGTVLRAAHVFGVALSGEIVPPSLQGTEDAGGEAVDD
jgi:hypothetical protein